MFNLENSPYNVDPNAEEAITQKIQELDDRIELLRQSGTLTDQTLKDYFGEKRYEQVAESNAIEGSTLSVGETEMAILRGVTLTGHDPAYVRDAQALNQALERLYRIATSQDTPTDRNQLLTLHSIIMNDRVGAGVFRTERVRISGAEHTPPKDWKQVVKGMEEWGAWSQANSNLSPVIRAIVLHTWLTHIHPFLDGNGRTARAIVTLELVRGGYPVPIIRRKERTRYINSLAESDQGGDLRSVTELFLERIEGALTGLETSAKTVEGFDAEFEKIQNLFESQLKIWKGGLEILVGSLHQKLQSIKERQEISFSIQEFDFPLDVEEFKILKENRPVSGSWLFVIKLLCPGGASVTRLGWAGYRSREVFEKLGQEEGPTIFFSKLNPNLKSYPKWLQIRDLENFPQEVTCSLEEGSRWAYKKDNGEVAIGSVIDVTNTLIEGLLKNVV